MARNYKSLRDKWLRYERRRQMYEGLVQSRKWLRALPLLLLAVALLGVTTVLADVSTDKYDYAPGETVYIFGDGMEPGETVAVDVYYPDGSLAQHHEVVADDAGNFSDTYVLPDDAPGGIYTLVATGLTSGNVFTTTFDPAASSCATAAGFNAAAARTSETEITVSWVDQCNNETEFHILRSLTATPTPFTTEIEESPVAGSSPASAEGGAFQVTDAGLACGTTYYYQVRPHKHAPGAQDSFSVVVSATTNPNAPSGLSATAVSDSQIDLSWTDNSSCESDYHIERSTDGVNFSEIDTVGAGVTVYSDTGLDCDTTYYYRVRAGKHDGTELFSAYSNTASDTTSACAIPTSTISTEIHREPGHTVVTSVTMGATIHDEATVTTTVNPIPAGSSVDFQFFKNDDCLGTPFSTENKALTGGSTSESVESSSYLVLAADIASGLSYKGIFNSGNTGQVPDATGACEPLTVLSSISGFHYHVISGPDAASNTGSYDCTLPGSAKGTTTACPAGTVAALVTKGNTNTYRVHITVTNNTGVTISEKVQGGLSAAPGVTYSVHNSTCGTAVINISQSGEKKSGTTQQGNVVTWTISSMADGTTCNLEVDVNNLKFSGTGDQPITSSWSEFQCLLGGPNEGFCEKSPYTNNLMAIVS